MSNLTVKKAETRQKRQTCFPVKLILSIISYSKEQKAGMISTGCGLNIYMKEMVYIFLRAKL